MMRSVKKLRRVAVNATDGRIGHVEQVYFDDERWTIRYLVVDTGREFGDRRVLVSPMTVVVEETAARGAIDVRLTRGQVADGPDIDTEMPVSRQKELEFNRYFILPPYWGGTGVWGAQMLPAELMRLAPEPSAAEQGSEDVHLRSSREIIGYRVRASDGKAGHVEDLLFEEASWRVRYIEVNTREWVGGRHVLVSPLWARSISWKSRAISLDLNAETVRSAPRYGSPETLTPEFEWRLRSHYGRPVD
jgi:uncharacterized protein YrrD